MTIRKLEIVNDGDEGRNKGELHFSYYSGGDEVATSDGYHRYGSGDVISATPLGSGREGVSFDLPANGDAQLDVGVVAEECDDYLSISNCASEAYEPPTAANNVPHDSGCDTPTSAASSTSRRSSTTARFRPGTVPASPRLPGTTAISSSGPATDT